jgi:type IV secretory pathway VirB2 component (pilin)
MKNAVVKWMPYLVIVIVALAGPGMSHAYAQSNGTPFDLTSARQETSNIVKFLLGALMSILAVAGCATIIHGLMAARKKGEWGEFLGGVAMAVIAFVAFVGFLKMGNISANPSSLMNDFQIK